MKKPIWNFIISAVFFLEKIFTIIIKLSVFQFLFPADVFKSNHADFLIAPIELMFVVVQERLIAIETVTEVRLLSKVRVAAPEQAGKLKVFQLLNRLYVKNALLSREVFSFQLFSGHFRWICWWLMFLKPWVQNYQLLSSTSQLKV